MGEILGFGVGIGVPRCVFSLDHISCFIHVFSGQQESADATLATLKAIEHPIARQAEVLVDMCSYAGTSNVLKVQALLHHCDTHIEKKDKDEEKEDNTENKEEEKEVDDTYQAFAVIGIALVAMGEDVGAEMSLRQFNHLVRL